MSLYQKDLPSCPTPGCQYWRRKDTTNGPYISCSCGYWQTGKNVHLTSAGWKFDGINPDFPQYRGAVRLWRYWKRNNISLLPMHYSTPWKPGINHADLYGIISGGGFYGWESLESAKSQEPAYWQQFHDTGKWLVGTFLGYGRVMVATMGARCEYAVPEYLLEPENLDYTLELLPLAERYRMRFINREQADSLRTGVVPWVKPEDLT